MKIVKAFTVLLGAILVTGCMGTQADKTVDNQFGGRQHLSNLQAGIWVDPNGCDHWIADDGAEGYLSQRLDPVEGKPVCSGTAPPNVATGSFKRGGEIADLI